MNARFTPPLVAVMRGEYQAMVSCAWTLRAQAAQYRALARDAEARCDHAAYQMFKAKAKASFRRARSYCRWARQRTAIITQLEEKSRAA